MTGRRSRQRRSRGREQRLLREGNRKMATVSHTPGESKGSERGSWGGFGKVSEELGDLGKRLSRVDKVKNMSDVPGNKLLWD